MTGDGKGGRAGREAGETRDGRLGALRASRAARIGAVVLGVAVLAAAGLAVLWVTLPDPRPLAERWPETTAYMELRRQQAREAGREAELRWEPVALSRVPEQMVRAVRVAEDAAFFQHEGVDWHEVRASVREWWSGEERLRGASTLTMQLARNLYLSPDRSLWRKLREVLLARRLESRLSKRRILELYLSVVELGPHVFGVEAAAGHYWDLPVAALDRRQAAELAATLPSPLKHNPHTRTRQFLWRSRLIHRRAFGADTAGAAGDTSRLPLPAPADTSRPPLPAPDSVVDGTGDPAPSPSDTVDP